MSVDRVSSTDVSAGEQHAIMSAIEDPPRLSISSLVSFESLEADKRLITCAKLVWITDV